MGNSYKHVGLRVEIKRRRQNGYTGTLLTECLHAVNNNNKGAMDARVFGEKNIFHVVAPMVAMVVT